VFLSQNTDVGDCFVRSLVPLSTVTVDEGLRMLMCKVLLPSVSGRVSKLLETYSNAFYRAQDEASRERRFGSELECFVLVYSIVLLNVDLHNSAIKRKMTKKQFVKNARAPLPEDEMFDIYDRISRKPLGIPQLKNSALGDGTVWWSKLFK